MELTVEEALQKGIEAHKAGKAQEADQYYTAILKANPKHPDANHNMGVLAVDVGKVEQALPFLKIALEANPNIAQFWISYIDALIKLDRMVDAKAVFDQAKSNGAKGNGFDRIESRIKSISQNLKIQDPPENQMQFLIDLYTQGKYQETLNKASKLLIKFPNAVTLLNIIGAANKCLGKLEEAIEIYKRALTIKPDFAEALNNMGQVLKDQGKLNEAIEAFEQALFIKPDYASAYNNVGITLKDQGKLDEAITSFKTAIRLKHNYAEALNNMGNALKEQNKFKEAIEAFQSALEIRPNFAEAYNNIGNTLQNQNLLEEAGDAYKKALFIKPNFANAYLNLSKIKKYNADDPDFRQIESLLASKDITIEDECNLSFALAKMYEDVSEFKLAFEYFSKGNSLRKKYLNYSLEQDKKIFTILKKTQSLFSENCLKLDSLPLGVIPIFIVGMPRSGTSLVEQIISSHSKVTGAGELHFVSQYGTDLVLGAKPISQKTIEKFRSDYICKIEKLSINTILITDKMPQNFRFIPLICASFPEAKIIHVKRDPAATCWSNFKQNFSSKNLAYCYNIADVVGYYQLYSNLMKTWEANYANKIYDLDYDKLTVQQDSETKNLIEYLNLNWEDNCLSPETNKRWVATASQQQVRRPVYKGSSIGWKEYKPFLDGAFDTLKSI